MLPSSMLLSVVVLLCAVVCPVLLQSISWKDARNDNVYSVAWKVVNGSTAVFDIVARTTGWVGLGFSSYPSMAGADIVVAGVGDIDGRGYISDRHALSNSFPFSDTTQNYNLLSSRQNGTHTSVTVERKINTCDPSDRSLLEAPFVLWAFGILDASLPNELDYHLGNRGSQQWKLLPDLAQASIKQEIC